VTSCSHSHEPAASSMKVTITCSSETMATIYQTIRHIIKEINLHINRRENLTPSMYAGAHHWFTYCGIFAQGKNRKVSRDNRCYGTSLQTGPLLGNRLTRNTVVTGKRRFLRDPCDSYVMQQQKNCLEVFSMRSMPKLIQQEASAIRVSVWRRGRIPPPWPCES
jgi:hypothetical protein